MADTKLSALTALATEPADTDEFYINDGGTSKKIAWSTIKAVFALAAQGATADTALQDVVDDTSPTLGGDLSLGGFKLLSGASNDAVIKLGDNAGTRKFSITDSDDAEVAYLDSNGTLNLAGDITTATSYIAIKPGGATFRIGSTVANGTGLNATELRFGRNAGDITISQETQSSDTTPDAFIVQAQHVTAGTQPGGALHLRGGNSTGGVGGDVYITPGTGSSVNGRVRFGTHASISGETLSGYIIIKDAGGTERKLAVVS